MIEISRWPIVSSVVNRTENTISISCYDPVEVRPIFVRTIDQVTANAHAIVTLVFRQDAWNTVLGNARHVQVVRQNFMASTMGLNPAVATTSSTVWERLARTNFVTSWIFISVLTVLGRQEFSSSSKRSLPCAKLLCHLNTTLQPKASSTYTYWII
jgi:hypothetical protein